MRTLMKNKHNAYRHSLRRIAMHSIRCDLMQPIAKETRQHAPIFRPAYSAGDTTVYLFTDATSHSVPCPRRFVYFCVITQQNVDVSDRRNLCFSWAYSDQTVRTFPYHKRPVESTHFQLFGGRVEPLHRNSGNFQRFTHAHTDSRFLVSKMLKIGA